jgi:hypothetical protein
VIRSVNKQRLTDCLLHAMVFRPKSSEIILKGAYDHYSHVSKTHSFGVNNINDSADFPLVLSVIDENYAANFNKSSESLESYNNIS